MDALVFNPTESRSTRYTQSISYIQALLADETDWVAGLANTVAVLHQGLGFFWTGFYRVRGKVLVLGPFQGPVAVAGIAQNKGVCGTAWAEQRTQIVPDVHAFAGHIACNPDSRSEIVLPIFAHNQVALILDIDSRQRNDFDASDQSPLEKLCTWLEEWLPLTNFGS